MTGDHKRAPGAALIVITLASAAVTVFGLAVLVARVGGQ